MRTLIKVQSAALAALAFTTVTVQAAETLSVVTFGGAYEAAAKKAYFEPFTQATGIGFSTESYDGGLAKLSAMEQAKNTTWDLIDLETNDAITACDEGLLQKFDKKTLGKTSDFIPARSAIARLRAWSGPRSTL
jgi:Spermidine/putrescine-binding periplasmic protein